MATNQATFYVGQTLWFEDDALDSNIITDTVSSIGPLFVTTQQKRVIDQRSYLWLNRKYSPEQVYFTEDDARNSQTDHLMPI